MCPSLFRSALGACRRTRTTPPQRCRCTPAGKADGARKTHTFVLRISLVLYVTRSTQQCALSKRAPYAFISSRLQQSLVPQTCGAREGEPKEKHVGSYLAAFFRLLGKSVCGGNSVCSRGIISSLMANLPLPQKMT